MQASYKRLSYITKVIIAQINIFFVLIFLCACDNNDMNGEISMADSLAEFNQPVAVKYIDGVLETDSKISNKDRMKLLLLKTKALNKLNCPVDSDILAELVDYFDRYGEANDKMLANYILGCRYIVDGNSSEALRFLRIAAEAADTADVACDYKTLHKIHVHTAMQLMGQNALTDAMAENILALRYALMAKDTFNAIITMEQRANIYMNQGHGDKALDIRSKLYDLYMKHGYEREAAISLWPLADMLIKSGKLVDAKRCLDVFEKKSGLIDNDGNIEPGYEAYYIAKGRYLTKLENFDSAEYYFKKCIRVTKSYFNLNDCYVGLSDIYKRKHNTDSVIKYSDMARMVTDSMYAKMNTTHIQQMRAMYDYNEYKLSAEVYKRKVGNARLLVVIVVFITSLIVLGILWYIKRKKMAQRMVVLKYESNIAELERAKQELCDVNERQQEEMKQIIEEKTNEIKRQSKTNENYLHNIQELEQSRKELYDFSERQKDKFNALIDEKNNQIEQLKNEMLKYEGVYDAKSIKSRYSDEPIVKQLKYHARKDFIQMNAEEVKQLKTLFAETEPFNKIESLVNSNEYQVCMLVRIGLTPSDICILTGLSQSNISNIRKRLLTKLTGRNGSSKDFDAYIMNL